jgi:DNA-binding response OmpR family regulator
MLSILYIDDDEDLLEICKIFLERSGTMQVDISRSARHALTLVATKHYDAIISDYEMPEMTGIAFLQNLRNAGNTIPFIIFTGRGREDIAIEAFDSGADYYIQKGGEAKSQFAELIHKVEKAVERKRTGTALEHTNSLLKATLESTADGILVVGNDGKIITCNQKFLQMWKIAEDLRSMDDDKKMLSSVLDQLENPEQFLLKVEEMYANSDLTSYDIIQFRDGRLFRRFSQAQKIGTTVVGRVWSFRDITLQNNGECELRAAYEQLSATEGN